VTNSWVRKSDFPGAAREFACGFEINGLGYLGTGHNGGFPEWDFYEYNPVSDSWVQKANFSNTYGVSAATSFVSGNFGYIGLGWTSNGYTDQFWKYDPWNNAWTQVAVFPGGPRAGAFGFANCGKGFVGLGYDGLLPQNAWSYDPASNSWSPIANFPAMGRSRAVAFCINAKGYIGTGSNINPPYMNDFWEYNLPSFTPVISGQTDICAGECTILTCSMPGTAYLWSIGTTTQSITVCLPGVYTVTVADACGTTGTASVTINQFPIPVIQLSSPFPYLQSNSDSTLLSVPPLFSGYQWLRNNTPLPVPVLPTCYAKQPGNYTCVAVDMNGCTGQSNVIRVRNLYTPHPPTGPTITHQRTTDNLSLPEFTVFPTPATAFIQLNFRQTIETPVTLMIYDQTGKKIRSAFMEPGQTQFVIDHIIPGMYVVEASNQAGKFVEKVLVVKQ
jgi:hypothetical protein